MRTNIRITKAPVFTHEGAVAANINPEQQLRRSVLACMLWEDSFYESGQSIADRIKQEVNTVLSTRGGAKTVADLAREARTKFKLRHAPLHLVNALVAAQTDSARAEIAGALTDVIQRPDEINEFISQYWAGKKQPLTNQIKKGLAGAFQKFNEYSLSRYANRDGAVTLRDALFLTHAKPKNAEQAEIFRKLANKELKAPENTWEVQLSAGADKKETFTRLFSEGIGALALLRNLRNATQAGVSDSIIREAIKNMNTERVLPFRFITAAKYAPRFEPELETAMFKCLSEHDKLAGKTVLVIDNSGSMYGTPVSSKSELTRADAAQALAMLLREVCEDIEIVVFSDNPVVVPPRRGFGLRDAVVGATNHSSTNTERALQKAAALGYDRCIVITDEQSHERIGNPVKDTKGYFINVASYQNGIGYKAWTHFDGFSEAIVDYILAAEQQ